MSIYKVANLFNKKLQRLALSNYLQLKEILNKTEALVKDAGKDIYDYINSGPHLDNVYDQAKKFMWKAYSQGVSGSETATFKNTLKNSISKVEEALKQDTPSAWFNLNLGMLKNHLDQLDMTGIPAQKPAPTTSPDAVEGIEDHETQMSRVGPGVSQTQNKDMGISYPQTPAEDESKLSGVVNKLVDQEPKTPDYFGEGWEE